MPKINSRAKGASGERELAEWLQHHFSLENKPQRNIEQVRVGGVDLIVDPFAFECKRVEKLDLLSWWSQVKRAVEDEKDLAFGLEPVVAFRQNKNNWEFLIDGSHVGIKGSFVRLTTVAFKKWVKSYIYSNYFTEFSDLNSQRIEYAKEKILLGNS